MWGQVFLGREERDGLVSLVSIESLLGNGGGFLGVVFLLAFPKVDELRLVVDGALDFVGCRVGAAGDGSRDDLASGGEVCWEGVEFLSEFFF